MYTATESLRHVGASRQSLAVVVSPRDDWRIHRASIAEPARSREASETPSGAGIPAICEAHPAGHRHRPPARFGDLVRGDRDLVARLMHLPPPPLRAVMQCHATAPTAARRRRRPSPRACRACLPAIARHCLLPARQTPPWGRFYRPPPTGEPSSAVRAACNPAAVRPRAACAATPFQKTVEVLLYPSDRYGARPPLKASQLLGRPFEARRPAFDLATHWAVGPSLGSASWSTAANRAGNGRPSRP